MKFWNKRRMKKREASEEVKHVGENGFAAFKVIEEEEEEEEKGSGGLRNLLGEEFARRSGGCCFWMNAMWVTAWRSPIFKRPKDNHIICSLSDSWISS
ncbi:hypothetical protein JHK87_047583 [Glycine soja]|nr:hypothetical protein JHK87_047583 [Glycine soja]